MPYLQKLKPDYTDDLEKASINRRYQSSKVEIFEAEENLWLLELKKSKSSE